MTSQGLECDDSTVTGSREECKEICERTHGCEGRGCTKRARHEKIVEEEIRINSLEEPVDGDTWKSMCEKQCRTISEFRRQWKADIVKRLRMSTMGKPVTIDG